MRLVFLPLLALLYFVAGIGLPGSLIASFPTMTTSFLSSGWAEKQRVFEERVRVEREQGDPEKRNLQGERQRFADETVKPTMDASRLDPKAKEIGRDGRFIAYENGTVLDTKTGLEWIAGPDKDTSWEKARFWVQRLAVDGGGWRMPAREELRLLYKKGAGTRNMTPLLKTTGWRIWSGKEWGISSARIFNFCNGHEHSQAVWNSDCGRGFAVRSRR